MQRGLWTMARGWSRPGVVLVVTSRRDRLTPIAEQIADHGLHCICATPGAIAEVFDVSIPDLVLLLADLSRQERAEVSRRHAMAPRQHGVIVHLLPPAIDLVEIVMARLPHVDAPSRCAVR